ncbi:hypothetical protein PV08_01289 [Exophiala spinifera]|uniref:SUN domain-containing protein n=1 Tax=Exophiala spinifera TaxID=91928 RepID=A0A0D2A7G0_9EURO|nr:uncharacterized protein PV08_01289 [Exophiala spinifera]KIW20712.1 hypothetical protein PV08_01289 [Exophiala spinifera]
MWYLEGALFILSLLDVAAATTSASGTSSLPPGTCPSRTANYITHSLRQQCITSSRTVNLTSASTTTDAVVDSTANVESIIQITTDNSNASSLVSSTATRSPASTSESETSVTKHGSVTSNPADTGVPPTEATHDASNSAPEPAEEDSPLGDGKFLSFEDWKKENLKQAGQSEHIGRAHGVEQREIKRRPTLDQDSLDALGDDAEINLDFSGFVADNIEPPTQPPPRTSQGIEDAPVDQGRGPRAGVRSKDAGTTCKERFNYASYDCAATILKTNPEAKGANAVLGKNKDSYMLNECSAKNKFIILELCDDISIDTIVLANYEFFSSTFRTFRVSVSDKYPVKIDKWKTLGTFEARNTRDLQAFLVENPVIWARYLRIEFLTHYGNEYFCPVSLIRVHGTTMYEDYKHDLTSLQGEEEEEEIEAVDGNSEADIDALVPEAVAEPLLTKVETVHTEVSLETSVEFEQRGSDEREEENMPANASQLVSLETVTSNMPTSPANLSHGLGDLSLGAEMNEMCDRSEESRISKAAQTQSSTAQPTSEEFTASGTSTSAVPDTDVDKSSISGSSVKQTGSSDTESPDSTTKPEVPNNTTTSKTSTTSGSVSGTKVSSSYTNPPPAAPTMQESFFKSVQKRLQMLESNSSLSLQYIEEQSRALRDAFQKVEQRQLSKTTSFLDHLNATVLNELRDFRQQYDQLWQSTVIELEMQRERYQQEHMAINARLGVLADEVIFQKRMSILQMILILICLGLVIFSKGSIHSYREMPFVQSVLARSPSSKWLNLTALESPTHSPPVTRASSTGSGRRRQGILKGHRRLPSEDTADEALSPSDPYTPLTPVSIDDPSQVEDFRGGDLGDPQFDPSLIERPGTSPPVLSASDTPMTPPLKPELGDPPVVRNLTTSTSTDVNQTPPMLVLEDATPPSKQLKWNLPDS